MKILLFCENKYAIDILYPIQEYVTDNHLPHEVLWYIHEKKIIVQILLRKYLHKKM